MKQYKIAFLISATSGIGTGARIHNRLPAVLDELGLAPDTYRLQPIATHDVVLQAADLAKKAERLIIVGGDGTAAAVVSGVRASGESVPVGIVPVGTGNDLARVTGMYKTLRKHGLRTSIQRCLTGAVAPIDIWRINESHYMVNYLSVGMDAAVVESFSRHRDKRSTPYPSSIINFCMYGVFGLKKIFSSVNGATAVTVKSNVAAQKRQLEGLRELVVSNIPSYAAGTLLSPAIDYADCHLDITTFKSIFRFAGLFLVKPSLRLQKWYGNTLNHYRGNEIELQLTPDNCLQIDGEDKTYLLDNTGSITIQHAGQGLIIQCDG